MPFSGMEGAMIMVSMVSWRFTFEVGKEICMAFGGSFGERENGRVKNATTAVTPHARKISACVPKIKKSGSGKRGLDDVR